MSSTPILTLLMVCALLCEFGCAAQSAGVKILISEGCVIVVEGASARQADEMLRSWNVDPDCQIEVRSTTGEVDQ